MPFALSNGVRIYYRLQGLAKAPPLVLLHTIGTDMGIHARTAPFLERNFRLLCIDIRGHGASDAPDTEYGLHLLAEDVLAAMASAGIERAIVCGTSLGGMIAMQLALDAPQAVAGLVLANTSARMDPALWPERIRAVRARGVASIAEGWVSRHFSEAFARANRALTDGVFATMAGMDSLGYLGCAAAIRDMDLLGRLGRISAPALVIGGEEDTPTPFADHGAAIAAAIPGATAEMLPAGHLACVEQPEMFARCVRALARRCA